jgi:hypothetical protein
MKISNMACSYAVKSRGLGKGSPLIGSRSATRRIGFRGGRNAEVIGIL